MPLPQRTTDKIQWRSFLAAALAVMITTTLASAGAEPVRPDVGPYVRFEAARTATICWDTQEAMPSILLIDDKGRLDRKVIKAKPTKEHRLTVDRLAPGRVYHYQVILTLAGERMPGKVHELDMAFNYVLPEVPERPGLFGDDEASRRCAAAAELILRRTRITQGYALVCGFGTGRLAYQLARRSNLIVVGLDDDASRVAQARKRLIEAGVYGPRINVRYVPNLAKLPLTGCFANLIVSERMLTHGEFPGTAGEIARVLRPAGGTALLGTSSPKPKALSGASLQSWLKKSSVPAEITEGEEGLWATTRRGALPGTGVWTHQYGRADNAAFAGEHLGAAAGTGDLQVQWLGRPGADFGIDRNPRMPAPLAANGRLFHQGLNRIIALDSYNGALLWVMEIPDLRRVNMPRDASNWCADEDRLYVVVGDKCWVLDAAGGRRVLTCRLPDPADGEKYDWGYVARQGDKLYGSQVKKGSAYTEYWGGANWYDKPTGYGTHKVCSDMLFSCQAATGKTVWKYSRGLIINTAIAVGGGRIYFVESRNREAMASPTHRVETPKLWEEMHMVALNADTGEVLWDKPIKTVPGTVVFYLSYAKGRLLVTSSSAGRYHLYTYDAKSGSPGWSGGHGWPSRHHGGHMQHPVIVDDTIFLEPHGYNLADGRVVVRAIGRREGCATYAASRSALFYRGAGRRVSVWGIRTGRVTNWLNLRPSCWLSIIPANGMLLAPEGGGGCWCGNWIETSLGFAPLNCPYVPAKNAGNERQD
ncbi:MAG: SAM-dependent methyltransferase [Planctomycetota bacterium]|jgi:outer membrane protein assembly factor BamB